MTKNLTHFVFVNENFSKICQIVIFKKKPKVLHEIHKEKSEVINNFIRCSCGK